KNGRPTACWVGRDEYERQHRSGRVVEDRDLRKSCNRVADALRRLVADDASTDRSDGGEELLRLVGPMTTGRTKKIARDERPRTAHEDLWRLVDETARKPADFGICRRADRRQERGLGIRVDERRTDDERTNRSPVVRRRCRTTSADYGQQRPRCAALESGRRVDGQGERSRFCLSVGRCQRTGRASAVRQATPKA
ncbi:hypothetical protein JG688_00006757, partial [Phytophthora aleatoria]